LLLGVAFAGPKINRPGGHPPGREFRSQMD
jgi:hypothetical protein